MFTHRLKGEEQINAVLPNYGGIYRDGIITFENDIDAMAFILKYSVDVELFKIEDY